MALRLRKDVQKASYYVWFLGAQEAKALRGSRALLPMIPRMVEKSKEQEPLKVTLQVSHKGLKIVQVSRRHRPLRFAAYLTIVYGFRATNQGSAKHFIPHGAITCSVQTEDIVACTLLLYNPATKCPLHVHAYRCDSEHTAQALHDQLQVLINRPENQKRFTELEARSRPIADGSDGRLSSSEPNPHHPWVGDGGSGDGSGHLLAALPNQIRILGPGAGDCFRGQSQACNTVGGTDANRKLGSVASRRSRTRLTPGLDVVEETLVVTFLRRFRIKLGFRVAVLVALVAIISSVVGDEVPLTVVLSRTVLTSSAGYS
uniref:PID domain-containing protein n=1 Tax=Anopheles farauti TaxID=69004 RepID=A0A182Q4K2_9DIPT